MRNAKIVCTLGPASSDTETIRALNEAGMSVARLNASHGTTDHRATVIDRVRAVDDESDRSLALMMDLKGPEVRTAEIDGYVTLETGSEVIFEPGETATTDRVGLSVSIAAAEPGDQILLDDGRIEATVTAVDGEAVTATIDSGGDLQSRKGVNIPGVELDIDLITPGDEQELKLAAEKKADFVAASFVRDGEDVYAIADKRSTARRSLLSPRSNAPVRSKTSSRSSTLPTASWSPVAISASSAHWRMCRSSRNASSTSVLRPACP